MELKIEVKLDKNTLKVVEGLVEAVRGITVSAPQAETVPVAEPVPTQTIKYTVQQLAVAAMQLKDQGRIADLQGLLVQFGVASMVELKDDQLDAFAQALRGLGVTL